MLLSSSAAVASVVFGVGATLAGGVTRTVGAAVVIPKPGVGAGLTGTGSVGARLGAGDGAEPLVGWYVLGAGDGTIVGAATGRAPPAPTHTSLARTSRTRPIRTRPRDVPAAHSPHGVVEPVALRCLPGAHSSHAPIAISGPNEPGRHGEHAPSPASAYVPRPHGFSCVPLTQ